MTQAWPIIIIVLLVQSAALVAGVYFDTDAPLSVAAFVSGIVTFFWLLDWAKQNESFTYEGALRAAFAGGIIVQYLFMVATAGFFSQGPEKLPPLTQSLLTSFTSIVGIVVAFFFGASAYVDAQKVKVKSKADAG